MTAGVRKMIAIGVLAPWIAALLSPVSTTQPRGETMDGMAIGMLVAAAGGGRVPA